MTALMAMPSLVHAGKDKIKIGILTDMSGVYAQIGGRGSVAAAQLAVDEFGGKVNGKTIEIVSADHQNKPDIGAAKAREWFDTQDVDMIDDLLNSSVAIAVQKVGAEKKRIVIVNGAGSTALTNKECSPYGVHYAYDTYALAKGTGTAMLKQGLNSWYFITADYAFGQALEKDTAQVVKDNGGTLKGDVKHPLGTTDFSSYLLQAQGSGAKVIGLANAGGDFTNAVKQAREFGLMKGGQTLAGLLVFESDLRGLGLATAQGMQYTSGFYWDMNSETRALSSRFLAKAGVVPSMVHAGVYSSVRHYLNAIKAAGTDDSTAVMAKMRELPINDAFAKNGKIRTDGRMVHDMYLMQVKTPAESKGMWDLSKVVSTIPGEVAFKPLAQSECATAKK